MTNERKKSTRWTIFISHVILAIISWAIVAWISNRVYGDNGIFIFIAAGILLFVILFVDLVHTYKQTKKM